MSVYDGLDPFDIFMSTLALGIVSGLTNEELWIACNLAEAAVEFDSAILAACDLQQIVEEHYER